MSEELDSIDLPMMSLADFHPPEEDLTAEFPTSSAMFPVIAIVFDFLEEKEKKYRTMLLVGLKMMKLLDVDWLCPTPSWRIRQIK